MMNELPASWYDFFKPAAMRISRLKAQQSMDQSNYNSLSLHDKAELIQKKGNFIDAEDFYSFKTLHYIFQEQQVEITYDYNGTLVSVEFNDGDSVPPMLDSQLDDVL